MSENKLGVYAIVLAGGLGTRLWPLSREHHPKQLSEIIEGESLIQATYKRLLGVFDHKQIFIVAGKDHKLKVQKHLRIYDPEISSRVISEPAGRNTAPATLLGTLKILKEKKDAVIFVFPSDHVIENSDKFYDSVKKAEFLAEEGFIVTFGIKPVRPESDYGYIEAGKKINENAFYMDSFIEKPLQASAEEYIKKDNWFWNSGIFAFKASVFVNEFKKQCQKTIDKFGDMDLDDLNPESYETLPDISVDKAIMELTDKGAVLPVSFNWSDIGSWKAVYDYLPKGESNNVLEGNVLINNSKNCLIKAGSRLVAANGLSDLAVIDTNDAVLISALSSTSEIRSIVDDLKKSGKSESLDQSMVHRHWGYFMDLHSEQGLNIRKLVVNPGSIISLQKNDAQSSKRWVVSKGSARVNSGDRIEILKEKDTISVTGSTVHSIENTGDDPLHIIEVQFGEILENDNLRQEYIDEKGIQ